MSNIRNLLAAALLASAGNAVAASSVDLIVRGLITPSACVPTLPNGNEVDIGKISAKDLKAENPTYLASRSLQLAVTCDAATLMALESKDNRAGSHYNNDLEFGLGWINNGTEKLGGIELRILNPVADGVAARAISSYDGGLTWVNDRYLFRDNLVSVAITSADTPIPVQLFTGDLNILPVIAPAKGLTLNNEVAIDGSVTLTVRYL